LFYWFRGRVWPGIMGIVPIVPTPDRGMIRGCEVD